MVNTLHFGTPPATFLVSREVLREARRQPGLSTTIGQPLQEVQLRVSPVWYDRVP